MKLNDKIRGALAGFAFGDALGFGTEFMTRHEISTYYPDKLRKFSQIIRDAHRIQYKRGDYTNDTRALVALLEDILKKGKYDIYSQARALKKFSEVTDFDLSPKIKVSCTAPGFTERPIATAHRVWQENGFKEASNESIQRAVLAGIIGEEDEVSEIARQLTLLTHDDSRCVASAAIVAHMVHTMLYEGREATFDELAEVSQATDSRATPFLKKAFDGEIEALEIDDPATQGWVRKSMSSSIWSILHTDNAHDAIYNVVDLGGDTDTNASLAGAMAGIKYGYDAIPEEKNNMRELNYILDLADRLTEYLEKNHS